MTDTSYPVTTIAGHDYASPTLPPNAHAPEAQRHAVSNHDETHEDDGAISCVCGFFDDDGWTVACDGCNRWQHQLCYYPQYEERSLPEELQHYCVECHPRPHDSQSARIRQQAKRQEQANLVNGIKRQAPKSHKKKVKEPGYSNGWPLDKSRHDRNSASPRDQPPPAKRPKTSHRTTDSITGNSTKGHSRKRTVSNVHTRRSLSRSPDTPMELYTESFLQSNMDESWTNTDVNLYNSINLSNTLSDWLNMSEEEFREQHGYARAEAMNRYEGDINQMPGRPHIQVHRVHDERVRDPNGNFPSWKTVTVEEPVAPTGYIGELKGHVGFKEEYQQDPANRWSLLRHPEPFVFFHPRLPIYIDARNEGTELRHVRRSCMPNARLQVLVTDSTDYHFCFIATTQINPEDEVAIAWDTSDAIPELLRRNQQSSMTDRDIDQLSSWVSLVLANCGPCACRLPASECKMSRFDRRGFRLDLDDEAQSVKVPKAKKKKPGHHISPLNTHFNSRSGSEARRVEVDDDPSDSRSTSGSNGRGSASRDITPNTHYSHNGSLSAIPELSERERKKLAKEEEMFRRQEEERTGKPGKKKRNSGGSNVNTPSATSSKQLGFGGPSKYADAGTPKQTGLPTGKPGRRPKGSTLQKTPPAKSISRVVKRPRPEYVNSEVQCDLDQEEESRRIAQLPVRKPYLSTSQRLLQRCAINNARRQGAAAVAEVEKSMKQEDKMDVDQPATSLPVPTTQIVPEGLHDAEPMPYPNPGIAQDTEMKDANSSGQPIPSVQVESKEMEDVKEEAMSRSPDVSQQPPIEPSAPPWPSQASHSPNDAPDPSLQQHRPDMHLQMPPPPANPFAAAQPSTLSTGTPTTLTGNMAQSPVSMTGSTPMFSPAVNAAVAPSPAKKKMSLSDYTKRKTKDKDKETEAKSERESSPASVTSVVPPLQASSSDVAKAGESSSAIDDDVKMEDGGAETSAAKA